MTSDTDRELSWDSTATLLPSREVLNRILNFLSTSNTQNLAFTIAFLTIVTYTLLGRIGLFLIGVVAGIALHSSWEAADIDLKGDQVGAPNVNRRKELSLSIANRLLDLSTPGLSRTYLNGAKCPPKVAGEISQNELHFFGFPQRTAVALNALTDAVIKNYVNHWYEPMLPTESTFPLSCRKLLISFVFSLSTHLSRRRTADIFLEFLTNSSSMTIVFLNELSTALRTGDGCLTPEAAIQHYLQSCPDSSLANILSENQQREKLKLAADDILSNFLDPQAYACSALRDFFREILVGVIFESMITSLSRPDSINQWIVHLLREGEPEIMSAIDAGVEGAQEKKVAASRTVSNDSKLTSVAVEASASQIEHGAHFKDQKISFTQKNTALGAESLKNETATQVSQKHVSESYPRRSSQLSLPLSNQPAAYSMTGDRGRDMERSTSLQSTDFVRTSTECEPRAASSEPDNSAQISSPPISDSETSPMSVNSSTSTTTLFSASVSIDDCSESDQKTVYRSRPTSDYLIQIEPASIRCTGWMVLRSYADFESLHETIHTISRLNNIHGFIDVHPVLPIWKGQTKQNLVCDLQRYLQDALKHEALANSQRMKRFLEKTERFDPDYRETSTKSGFPNATQATFGNVGKGVLGVLSNAPRGVAEGSKAVLGGVAGVFGGGAGKKALLNEEKVSHSRSSSDIPKVDNADEQERHNDENGLTILGNRDYDKTMHSLIVSNGHKTPGPLDTECLEKDLIECPIDEGLSNDTSRSFDRTMANPVPKNQSLGNELSESDKTDSYLTVEREQTMPHSQSFLREQQSPITQEETQIAVELIFAVINELYSLSSAWNFRRTLLNAAKSYILRPGNPSLEMISSVIQESMIEANISDEALAFYLTRLRESALPTEEELRSWPQPLNTTEKARLRDTAKRVLISKGLPQALMGVMGASASREALEKIFECLQLEMISRGFVFSVLLQALRAVTF